MTEILISLSLLMIITVSDLRLMTFYLQSDKHDYYRTIEALRNLSEAEKNGLSEIPALPLDPPSPSEMFRAITLLSSY